jgi:hypothetical protein
MQQLSAAHTRDDASLLEPRLSLRRITEIFVFESNLVGKRDNRRLALLRRGMQTQQD